MRRSGSKGAPGVMVDTLGRIQNIRWRKICPEGVLRNCRRAAAWSEDQVGVSVGILNIRRGLSRWSGLRLGNGLGRDALLRHQSVLLLLRCEGSLELPQLGSSFPNLA